MADQDIQGESRARTTRNQASREVVLTSPDTPLISPAAELLQKGYRYALALTHHPEDAQDLVQEVWLNLSRRYGQVESSAILFAAVRNLFVDHWRRKKIVRFESLDQPACPNFSELVERNPGSQEDLDALLGILRPVEREAIFLHYYEGKTAGEIGHITSQPRGTVLSLLHRSIIKLRKATTTLP